MTLLLRERESERRNRESVGSNVKLYDCAIVLDPLIGYFRAKIISYKNLACECVARASQYWNFIGDNLGYSNCKKFEETNFIELVYINVLLAGTLKMTFILHTLILKAYHSRKLVYCSSVDQSQSYMYTFLHETHSVQGKRTEHWCKCSHSSKMFS